MARGLGFTLVETLLAATLSLMALGLITWALLPLLRYSSRGMARAEMAQAAVRCGGSLAADLRTAPPAAIALPTTGEPGLLSIHPEVSVTDSGAPVFDQHLVVYGWDSSSGSLTRYEWTPAGLTNDIPVLPTPVQLRAAVSLPGLKARRLESGLVSQFSLKPASSTATLPLHLRMLLEIGVPGQAVKEQLEYVQDIFLRNGGN